MRFNWDQMRCVNRQMNLTNEVHVGLCLLPTFVNPRLGEPQTDSEPPDPEESALLPTSRPHHGDSRDEPADSRG